MKKVDQSAGREFCAVCCACGKVMNGLNQKPEAIFADLDGKPFSAYYCEDCAKKTALEITGD
jgi:ribosomal protein L34E